MIREVGAAQGEISMILPGGWSWIPLDDDALMKGRITALVKQQVGRQDRLASVRRESRDEMIGVAERARDAGAESFAISTEMLPGVPFPASLIISRSPWPPESAPDADPGKRLVATFPDAELLEHRSGPVARRSDYSMQTVGEEQTPTLECEYFLPMPFADRLLYIVINAPMVPERDPFVLLFDTIVDSVTWRSGPIPVEDVR